MLADIDLLDTVEQGSVIDWHRLYRDGIFWAFQCVCVRSELTRRAPALTILALSLKGSAHPAAPGSPNRSKSVTLPNGANTARSHRARYLDGGVAAVNEHVGTAHKTCLVGEQERHDVRHLVGLAQTAQGMLCLESVENFLRCGG